MSLRETPSKWEVDFDSQSEPRRPIQPKARAPRRPMSKAVRWFEEVSEQLSHLHTRECRAAVRGCSEHDYARFRTLTMNKFRDDDTLGKIKADSITSSIKIRSIEPVPGMPWVYQVFAAKEIHR